MGHSAANLPLLLSIDGTDRWTDGCSTVSQILHHIPCEQCQLPNTLQVSDIAVVFGTLLSKYSDKNYLIVTALNEANCFVSVVGKVLMLTSPDNPYVVLPLLHSRGSALQGLLSGYYKLTGDRVSLAVVISFHS